MILTEDAKAILLICSSIALQEDSVRRPYSVSEWNKLLARLRIVQQTPGALLGQSAQMLEATLRLSSENPFPELSPMKFMKIEGGGERLAYLLERGVALAIELERLERLGIWVSTWTDPDYPQRLKERLGRKAPPVLFGSGDKDLVWQMGQRGLAVVGSRNATAHYFKIARQVGMICGQLGWILYSGGARGVDRETTMSALAAQGFAVSILAHSLEREIRDPKMRHYITKGHLTLITPYKPNAPFHVGNAMGRNKLIYALADYALVITSALGEGGTWAGAVEALENGWVPLFVLQTSDMLATSPSGNQALLRYHETYRQIAARAGQKPRVPRMRALPLPEDKTRDRLAFREWLERHATNCFWDSKSPPTDLLPSDTPAGTNSEETSTEQSAAKPKPEASREHGEGNQSDQEDVATYEHHRSTRQLTLWPDVQA